MWFFVPFQSLIGPTTVSGESRVSEKFHSKYRRTSRHCSTSRKCCQRLNAKRKLHQYSDRSTCYHITTSTTSSSKSFERLTSSTSTVFTTSNPSAPDILLWWIGSRWYSWFPRTFQATNLSSVRQRHRHAPWAAMYWRMALVSPFHRKNHGRLCRKTSQRA